MHDCVLHVSKAQATPFHTPKFFMKVHSALTKVTQISGRQELVKLCKLLKHGMDPFPDTAFGNNADGFDSPFAYPVFLNHSQGIQ